MSNLVPYKHDESLPVRPGEIVQADFKDIIPTWRWRDRNGRWFFPSDMETRHVFHTIKMIWNNFMPSHMAFSDARFYHFGPTYSMSYLKSALINLWPELEKRNNLTPGMIAQIEIMRRWIQGLDKDGNRYLGEGQKSLPAPEKNPLWDE